MSRSGFAIAWIVVEVALAFVMPLCGLVWVLFGVSTLLLTGHGTVDVMLEPGLFFIGGGAGFFALFHMLAFLLNGTSNLNRAAMSVCLLAGMSTATWLIVDSLTKGDDWFLAGVFIAPLLSGLHVLYLGRSYFSGHGKATVSRLT
jgi:hypothetical protein